MVEGIIAFPPPWVITQGPPPACALLKIPQDPPASIPLWGSETYQTVWNTFVGFWNPFAGPGTPLLVGSGIPWWGSGIPVWVGGVGALESLCEDQESVCGGLESLVGAWSPFARSVESMWAVLSWSLACSTGWWLGWDSGLACSGGNRLQISLQREYTSFEHVFLGLHSFGRTQPAGKPAASLGQLIFLRRVRLSNN